MSDEVHLKLLGVIHKRNCSNLQKVLEIMQGVWFFMFNTDKLANSMLHLIRSLRLVKVKMQLNLEPNISQAPAQLIVALFNYYLDMYTCVRMTIAYSCLDVFHILSSSLFIFRITLLPMEKRRKRNCERFSRKCNWSKKFSTVKSEKTTILLTFQSRH